jgi:hypothetical protein
VTDWVTICEAVSPFSVLALGLEGPGGPCAPGAPGGPGGPIAPSDAGLTTVSFFLQPPSRTNSAPLLFRQSVAALPGAAIITISASTKAARMDGPPFGGLRALCIAPVKVPHAVENIWYYLASSHALHCHYGRSEAPTHSAPLGQSWADSRGGDKRRAVRRLPRPVDPRQPVPTRMAGSTTCARNRPASRPRARVPPVALVLAPHVRQQTGLGRRSRSHEGTGRCVGEIVVSTRGMVDRVPTTARRAALEPEELGGGDADRAPK